MRSWQACHSSCGQQKDPVWPLKSEKIKGSPTQAVVGLRKNSRVATCRQAGWVAKLSTYYTRAATRPDSSEWNLYSPFVLALQIHLSPSFLNNIMTMPAYAAGEPCLSGP